MHLLKVTEVWIYLLKVVVVVDLRCWTVYHRTSTLMDRGWVGVDLYNGYCLPAIRWVSYWGSVVRGLWIRRT